ncbi:MAG: TlpA family protein disulfide reductase [Elusimicrobiota bacterium]
MNSIRRFTLVFLFSCCFSAGCRSQTNSSQYEAMMGATQVRKAPGFQFTDMNGKSVSLVNSKGKVVFIDFWATWCPPCVRSMPEVSKLHDDYEGKKVEILSLSLDENREDVVEFLRRGKYKNRVALVGESNVPNDFGLSSIPGFFIINKDGYIEREWAGYSPLMPVIWRKEIDRLLKS